MNIHAVLAAKSEHTLLQINTSFFMAVIYIEVNSELSNHPTDNKSIKFIYALFIGSLALNAALYAHSHFNANSSDAHTNIESTE